jgi:hypothetical protein
VRTVTLLVSITALALALDFVDGWVARQTRTTATLGAWFDGGVDAFRILILSVYVARSVGASVATHLFLDSPVPPRRLPPRDTKRGLATGAHVDSYLQSLGGKVSSDPLPSECTCRRLSRDVASRVTPRSRKVVNKKYA